MVGTKPSWLTLNHSTGQLTGTPTATAAATSVTFRIRETNNASNSDTITVSFPAVTGAETFAFDTDADLGTKPGGVTFAPITITATASEGTAFTYLFVSNDPTNFAITVTNDNYVSGIPPLLLNAATFEIEGEIKVGGIVKNTRTFTILISAYSPCLSPSNNICG